MQSCQRSEGRVGHGRLQREPFMGAAGQTQAGPGGAATPHPPLYCRAGCGPESRPASVAPGRTHEGWCSCSSLGGRPGAAVRSGSHTGLSCGQVILGSGVGCWGCPCAASSGPQMPAPLPT